jgi:hypothetical protein
MGFYSAEADIATFISDMDMLNAFRFKTLPTQEFLVHEQAMKKTSTRRAHSFIPIFNATTD